MRTAGLAALVRCLGGCLIASEVAEVPLARLQARMYLLYTTGSGIAFDYGDEGIAPDPCPLLPEGTIATLDGLEGIVDPGGFEEAHGRRCLSPVVSWGSVPEVTAPSTIVVDDGETAWTFVVHKPFAPRAFELVSPAGGTLHTGDPVVMRLPPGGDRLSHARAVALTGNTYHFELEQGAGVSVVANEVRFTVPTVPDATTTLYTTADVEIPIDRCDAPLGCNTTRFVSTSTPVTLAL